MKLVFKKTRGVVEEWIEVSTEKDYKVISFITNSILEELERVSERGKLTLEEATEVVISIFHPEGYGILSDCSKFIVKKS